MHPCCNMCRRSVVAESDWRMLTFRSVALLQSEGDEGDGRGRSGEHIGEKGSWDRDWAANPGGGVGVLVRCLIDVDSSRSRGAACSLRRRAAARGGRPERPHTPGGLGTPGSPALPLHSPTHRSVV